MCNTCNSCGGLWNLFGGCGCNNGCGNTFNGNSQFICRDCNGNIWVRTSNGNSCCGCNACHSCNSSTWNNCGCNNSNGSLLTANGCGCNRACVTVCGNALTLSQNRSGCGSSNFCTDGDAYYARQFGLTNSGRNSCSCGCNG